MTKTTKNIIKAAAVGLVLVGATYIRFQYFLLPELPPIYLGENGEWLQLNNGVHPYDTSLPFAEWPIPVQQAFIMFASLAFLVPFALLVVVDIFDWIFFDILGIGGRYRS